MMRKIFILGFALSSGQILAQSAAEEAIILNQELEFLEDSVSQVQAISVNTSDTKKQFQKDLNQKNLEKIYFGEEAGEDVVNTKSAAQKRRGL